MSRILYTVQNLVDEIRAQCDEENTDSVDTNRDILTSLNRGQDYAFDILANKYPEPILAYTTLTLISDQAEYEIPHYVFEDRIQKIEIRVPSGSGTAATTREVQRVFYRDLSNYESASKTNVPYYYAIVGRKIRLVPTPTGTFSARMWYVQNPEKLVLPHGRITVVNSGSNYVILDAPSTALTTVADQLGSYVNLVDGQTGAIHGSMQVQNIIGNKITLRTVPTRTTVVGRSIVGSIPTEIGPDDYLSPVDGTCVPYFGRPLSNFLIQFSVAEIIRKLGGPSDTEEKILAKFEQQVARIWSGREQQLRVKKRSQNWGVPTRRWYFE